MYEMAEQIYSSLLLYSTKPVRFLPVWPKPEKKKKKKNYRFKIQPCTMTLNKMKSALSSLNASSGSLTVQYYSPWMRNPFLLQTSEWSKGTLEPFCLFISTSVEKKKKITRDIFTAVRSGKQQERIAKKGRTALVHCDPFLTPFILHMSNIWSGVFLALEMELSGISEESDSFFVLFFFPLDFWAITDEEAVLKCH